jgi:predicted N-acetyltransferase YhbS
MASVSQLLVRPATPADVAAIRRLEREWTAEGSTYGVVPDEDGQIERSLGPLVLVAEVEGRVVGFIAGARRVSGGMAVAPEGTP